MNKNETEQLCLPNITSLVIYFDCIFCYNFELLQRVWVLRIFYISYMI